MTPYQMAAVGVSSCVAVMYAWPIIKKLTPAELFKHVLAIVAAALLVMAFLPDVRTPIHEPQETSRVKEVLRTANKLDRARVRAFYSAMADVVGRDTSVIKTVGVWRSVNANALDLAFKGTDLPGKYAGLDTAIDERLISAIGKEDASLTDDKRKSLVVALQEISDAAK